MHQEIHEQIILLRTKETCVEPLLPFLITFEKQLPAMEKQEL